MKEIVIIEMLYKVHAVHPIWIVGRRLWSSALLWRHNGRDSASNHQPHGCLPFIPYNRLFMRRWKQTSKLRITGLCAGTDEFPAQMASKSENDSIWWRRHGKSGNITDYWDRLAMCISIWVTFSSIFQSYQKYRHAHNALHYILNARCVNALKSKRK